MKTGYVYFDNAASTRIDDESLSFLTEFLRVDYSNPSQPYSFSAHSKRILDDARSIIASCINALPEEIVFTSGGSEANNTVIKGVCTQQSDIVVTSAIEHHSVLKTCETFGRASIIIEVDKEGLLRTPDFKSVLRENKCKLASVMMVNNEIGTIQPIKFFAEIAHRNGALFHTDAVQAIGHIRIDVKDLGVDYMSASAHKFNGPKGIGFLYIKKGSPISSLITGGKQEFGIRAGTENAGLAMAMAIALRNNLKSVDENVDNLKALRERLLTGLNQCGFDFIVNGSKEMTYPGIVSISFKGAEGEVLMHRLDLAGFAVSTGAACDSQATRISHVLSAIDCPSAYKEGTIRVSISNSNTIQEVDSFIKAIARILS